MEVNPQGAIAPVIDPGRKPCCARRGLFGVARHPHPIHRSPALTGALKSRSGTENTMTAQLDHWASTDHDPTSFSEAMRQLTLITAQPASEAGGDHDVPDIDELAVAQVAEDGLRLRLRGADRDEAVRRMHGRLDIDLIAWRLHTTARTVHRVAARLRLTALKPTGADQSGDHRGPAAPASRLPHAAAYASPA
jgi:hypothetical protein